MRSITTRSPLGLIAMLLSVVLIVVLTNCKTDVEVREPAPDISQIKVQYNTARTEQGLPNVIKSGQVGLGLGMYKQAFPQFYELYFTRILPIKGYGTPAFGANVAAFFKEESIQELLKLTATTYSNYKTDVDDPLREMFSYLKYYFPDYPTPNVYTFISEFGHQVFLFPDKDKDGVGIGLDMFLGDQYPYTMMAKDNPAFSQYLAFTFSKEYIPRKVANVIADDMVGTPGGNKLLDYMIHNGKRLYILEKLLPTTDMSIIMEYTPEQMEWVRESELGMWAFFFDQELFYETDMLKINKYINPSPNSPGMPDEAPGRTANYMGLQIVKAYMKRNPNMTLQGLIAQKDAQLIMDESRYKPKRK